MQLGTGAQHGQSVVEAIRKNNAHVEVYLAAVFEERLVCSAGQVVDALEWLVGEGVNLINMSFGLQRDREVLRLACRAALEQGICLVAASPAQGAPCYPASYPGVLRATGDARCGPGEISFLDSAQADFGGYPGDRRTGVAGASLGCASVTAALANIARSQADLSGSQARGLLIKAASYVGVENRGAAAIPGRGAGS